MSKTRLSAALLIDAAPAVRPGRGAVDGADHVDPQPRRATATAYSSSRSASRQLAQLPERPSAAHRITQYCTPYGVVVVVDLCRAQVVVQLPQLARSRPRSPTARGPGRRRPAGAAGARSDAPERGVERHRPLVEVAGRLLGARAPNRCRPRGTTARRRRPAVTPRSRSPPTRAPCASASTVTSGPSHASGVAGHAARSSATGSSMPGVLRAAARAPRAPARPGHGRVTGAPGSRAAAAAGRRSSTPCRRSAGSRRPGGRGRCGHRPARRPRSRPASR